MTYEDYLSELYEHKGGDYYEDLGGHIVHESDIEEEYKRALQADEINRAQNPEYYHPR